MRQHRVSVARGAQLSPTAADDHLRHGSGRAALDDQLLLVGDYAITGTTSVTPSAPAGWTLLTSQVANGLESYVWTRRAVVGD